MKVFQPSYIMNVWPGSKDANKNLHPPKTLTKILGGKKSVSNKRAKMGIKP